MEYLVEMTTRVPAGVSPDAVEDVRAREAAHSRELAQQGILLRLFRPPLQPGEWRTFGLFAAGDEGELEQVLSGMPLRVWRTDAVTALSPHPNDVAVPHPRSATGPEFLVTFSQFIPAGTPSRAIEDRKEQESARARQLAEQGNLERLWQLPGQGRALGLFRAENADEMRQILAELPLAEWLQIETTRLDIHPSDPPLALHQTNC
jgi:muconolactone delta-isomerase